VGEKEGFSSLEGSLESIVEDHAQSSSGCSVGVGESSSEESRNTPLLEDGDEAMPSVSVVRIDGTVLLLGSSKHLDSTDGVDWISEVLCQDGVGLGDEPLEEEG